MAFIIYPNQQICNRFGKTSVTTSTLTINNGLLSVNNYLVPLDKILYIREV